MAQRWVVKTKPWKELSKGEQNQYYYIWLGYSKMTNKWNMPNEYQEECKKREKQENKKKENEYGKNKYYRY